HWRIAPREGNCAPADRNGRGSASRLERLISHPVRRSVSSQRRCFMLTMDGFDFKDRKALVRVDLNVPLDANFKVTDDNRSRAIIPTVKKILKDGGSVILMSHLGRPKGRSKPELSLKPIAKHLEEILDVPVQ